MKSALRSLLLLGALLALALTGWAQTFRSFVDSFDADLSHWTNLTDSRGSWTLANGQLTGYWPTAFAQYPQANLVVANQDLTADYDATFTTTYPGAGGVGFALWYSQTAKLNVNLSASGVTVEKRVGAQGTYYVVATATFATPLADGPVTMRLQRRAKVFTVFVTGVQVLQFTDNDFSGNMRVGVKAYGTAVYDAFSFTDAAGFPPDTGGDGSGGDEELEQLLDDALAALDAANAQIASLQSQLDAANTQIANLQQQLSACGANGTALQEQVDSLTAANALLQQQIVALTTERDQLSAELVAANTANASLQSQVTALQQQLATCATETAQLQQQVSALQTQVAQLVGERNSLAAQLAAANALAASLADANAALQQQVAQLTSERDALSAANATLAAQVAQLTAENLLLQGQVGTLQAVDAAVTASLARLEADFRNEFNDPGFFIPGNGNADKVDRLVDSIIELNHGRALGVYDGLQ